MGTLSYKKSRRYGILPTFPGFFRISLINDVLIKYQIPIPIYLEKTFFAADLKVL